MSIKVVILAAGKGTRMKSAKPKVLHELGGKSLLKHVIDNISSLKPDNMITVVGHKSEQIIASITDTVEFVEQVEQKGTGHAVQQVLGHINDNDKVVIAYGDVPLTQKETFEKLLGITSESCIGLLTFSLEDPTGYGRIVRDNKGRVLGIVEQKDANDEQLAISELNSGMLSITGANLKSLLSRIDDDNAQGEYYLTDIFGLAAEDGLSIETVSPSFVWEVAGVNSRIQLAELERIYQLTQAEVLMTNGVTLNDPSRIDVRGSLTTGTDVEIDVNCVFLGDVVLGDNVKIGPNCVIKNCTIDSGTVVQANCVFEDSKVGENGTLGPFARLRPGSILASQAHIGNFVEIKNSTIDVGSKVNHLSYIGDCDIGKTSNIGAGTITCNYDGANKHRTIMGDNVFIGSNAALVAPVEIDNGATIGAGSVITRKVEPNQLAVTRSAVKTVNGYQRPQKTIKPQD